jgi:hypothetical protein
MDYENEIEQVNKLWKRLAESLTDTNSQHGLHRLVNNAEMLSAYMEANGILSESKKVVLDFEQKNAKINMSTHNREIDNAIVFVILKGLTTIPTKTEAFRMGLIDAKGKLIRKPKTQKENEAISNLDLLFFKLREWLAPRIAYLSTVSWVKGVMNNIRGQNYFKNASVLAKQYAVRKINDELWKILEH